MSRHQLRMMDMPTGDGFTLGTLDEMGKLVRHALEGEARIHSIARNLMAGASSVGDQLALVYDWLMRSYRYASDPDGYERITGVPAQLDALELNGVIAADCDDMATMGATLLRAMGIPAGFCVVAKEPEGRWVHVFPVAIIGDRVVPLDAQERTPLGQLPPGAERVTVWALHA